MSIINTGENTNDKNPDDYWVERSRVTDNWWIERVEYNESCARLKIKEEKKLCDQNSPEVRMHYITKIPIDISHKNSTKIIHWYRRYAASLQLAQIIESICFGLCRSSEQTIIWWRVGDWKNSQRSRTNLNEAVHTEGHQQIIETIRNLIRRGADVNFKNSLNIVINRAEECEQKGYFSAEMPTEGAKTFRAIARILIGNGAHI